MGLHAILPNARGCFRRLVVASAVVALTVWLPTAPANAIAYASPGYPYADFDNDGFGDLAIGAPGESIGAVKEAGMVHVFYGTSFGFTTEGSEAFHQSTPNVEGVPQTADHFGQSLAVGDFDADGFDDLAIGIPGEKLGNTPDTGMVYVLRGSPTGLTTVRSRALRQGTAGIGGGSESGDRFGWALATGNFDGDAANGHSIDDLAIGVPGEDLDGKRDGGLIHVLEGNAGAGLFGKNQSISQNTPGLEGDIEGGERFGYSLASGNWNGDSVLDLAVGSPYEGIAGRPEEGVVFSMMGDPGRGIDPETAQFMSQDTIFQKAEGHAMEHFGYALAAGDFNRASPREKKYDDLAIGVPGDLPADSGAVNIVFGTEHGFEFQGEKWFQGKAASGGGAVLGAKEAGDQFGAALIANDFDGNGVADLAIGVPGEDSDSGNDVGGVHILASNGTDLDPNLVANQFVTQDTPNVPGRNESGDMIGAALGSSDFGSDGRAELMIGCPGEDLGSRFDAGVAIVIGVSRPELIGQSSRGVDGDPESGDRFGGSAG